MQKNLLSRYIGRQIRRYRDLKGMTQKELGDKIGVKHNTISSYESGTNLPEGNTLFAIANVLEISIDAFFPDNESRKETTMLPIYKNGEVDGYGIIPKEWVANGEYFFLRVPDDSMESSRVREGDLLLIRTQDYINDGELAALILEGNILIRRVFHRGEKLILQSDKSPPILVPSNIKILGKVSRNIIKY